MRPLVAVAMGGYSSEFGISLLSGSHVFDVLDPVRYDPVRLELHPGDGWKAFDASGIPLRFSERSWSIVDLDGSERRIDAILNLIHGHPGEDGTLAMAWEQAGIPYSSCSPAASALTFHKFWTNAVAERLGARVMPSVHVRRGADETAVHAFLAEHPFPLFVKPCRSGSSYGVTRITSADEWPEARDAAWSEDDELVVEQGVVGTELGCGAFVAPDGVRILGITEIVPKKAFFDFEAKYHGASEEITPARISDSAAEAVRRATLNLVDGMALRGFVRADYILPADGSAPVLIEINTIPGMSAESIVPRQLKAAGISMRQFAADLTEATLNRHEDRAVPRIF
ncbi:MAG: D-alanine--D-alanine ligase family protein [Schleiferiaceae bacterium]